MAVAVQREFTGIPSEGDTIGDPQAPVEIIEYGDISCPICKMASEGALPEIVDRLVRTGRAKMTFRPIAFISASSQRGALGAEAAAMQDAMWPFVTLIYANQGPESDPNWLTDADMEGAAAALGLDVARWKRDYSGDEVTQRYLERQSQADADKVTGTPFFVVKGPGGQELIVGAENFTRFEQAVTKVG